MRQSAKSMLLTRAATHRELIKVATFAFDKDRHDGIATILEQIATRIKVSATLSTEQLEAVLVDVGHAFNSCSGMPAELARDIRSIATHINSCSE